MPGHGRPGESRIFGEVQLHSSTPRPAIISRAYLWRPKFEQEITAAMKAICPDAITEIEWDSPDT